MNIKSKKSVEKTGKVLFQVSNGVLMIVAKFSSPRMSSKI